MWLTVQPCITCTSSHDQSGMPQLLQSSRCLQAPPAPKCNTFGFPWPPCTWAQICMACFPASSKSPPLPKETGGLTARPGRLLRTSTSFTRKQDQRPNSSMRGRQALTPLPPPPPTQMAACRELGTPPRFTFLETPDRALAH
jgi:hypothetical protein